MRNFLLLPSLLILCLCAAAQNAGPAAEQQLGKISFPTSCSAEAQPAFERGIALLHSFQYATADVAFADAAKKDPQCGMAYWGQAMSLYHQLWSWPSSEDLKKGHELMRKAAAVEHKTEREQFFIRAAAAFYDDNAKLDRNQRQNAYSGVLAEMYQKFPQDGEATAFYALSLLPSYHTEHKESVKKAVAILTELFTRQPDHPGAAHYLIHATDSPELAPRGLEAARRYARIAPSSAHALHMPAHVFSRLGLWQDVIDSNVASASAAAAATKSGSDNESTYQLHAMKYLQYAYEQTGQAAAAKQIIDSVKDVPGAKPDDISDDGSVMKALYMLETHRWDAAGQLSPEVTTVSFAKMRVLWARAVAESRAGNKHQAKKDLDKLHSALKAEHQEAAASPRALEAEAWVAWAQGRRDEAIKKMQDAVNVDDDFGVDASSVPASEMLGDLFIELKRPAEALAAYEAMLKQAPNRFNSVFGAGHAAELSGNQDKASQYYATLMKLTGPKSDRPEIEYAKVYLAKKLNAQTQDPTH